LKVLKGLDRPVIDSAPPLALLEQICYRAVSSLRRRWD